MNLSAAFIDELDKLGARRALARRGKKAPAYSFIRRKLREGGPPMTAAAASAVLADEAVRGVQGLKSMIFGRKKKKKKEQEKG